MNLELLNWADMRRTRGGGNSLQYGMKINVSGHSNTLRFRFSNLHQLLLGGCGKTRVGCSS
jgi:hypothetical protein